MADTAFQTQYRQEFIAGFEQTESLVRKLVTTEAVIKGNQATFLVADSGGAEAQTRGVNGLIPARADELEQLTAPLVEWHDLVRKTNFNVFASQGNQREIMQKTTMGVINRKIDQDVTLERSPRPRELARMLGVSRPETGYAEGEGESSATTWKTRGGAE